MMHSFTSSARNVVNIITIALIIEILQLGFNRRCQDRCKVRLQVRFKNEPPRNEPRVPQSSFVWLRADATAPGAFFSLGHGPCFIKFPHSRV